MSKPLSVLFVCAILLAGCSPNVAPVPAATSTALPTRFPTLGPILTSVVSPTASSVPTRFPTLTPTPAFVPSLPPTPTLAATKRPAYPDFSITRVRGGGLGCGDKLTIDAAGNAVSEQICPPAQSNRAERKIANIMPWQIEEIVAAINKADVWAIENDEYHCCDFAPLSISVTLNGRSKTVSRYDAAWNNCHESPLGAIPEPGTALCELGQTIDRIAKSVAWVTVWSGPATATPVLSSAKVVLTVYTDQNGDGTPGPGEGLDGIPVQLRLPDGKILAAITHQGLATFNMSGYVAGNQITAVLPDLYRSYQFYLPQTGNVPIVFSFAKPTLPTKSP